MRWLSENTDIFYRGLAVLYRLSSRLTFVRFGCKNRFIWSSLTKLKGRVKKIEKVRWSTEKLRRAQAKSVTRQSSVKLEEERHPGTSPSKHRSVTNQWSVTSHQKSRDREQTCGVFTEVLCIFLTASCPSSEGSNGAGYVAPSASSW